MNKIDPESIEKQLKLFERNNFYVFETKQKGRTVYTKTQIKKDTVIMEYEGQLMRKAAGLRRDIEYELKQNFKCYLVFFNYGNRGYCIDATEESNSLGRLICHSENPNMKAISVKIHGDIKVVFVSIIDIQENEELSWDYNESRKHVLNVHPWLKRQGSTFCSDPHFKISNRRSDSFLLQVKKDQKRKSLQDHIETEKKLHVCVTQLYEPEKKEEKDQKRKSLQDHIETEKKLHVCVTQLYEPEKKEEKGEDLSEKEFVTLEQKGVTLVNNKHDSLAIGISNPPLESLNSNQRMKKLEEIIKEKNEEILELEKKLIDINTKYDKLREESFSLSLTETTGQKILEKLNLLVKNSPQKQIEQKREIVFADKEGDQTYITSDIKVSTFNFNEANNQTEPSKFINKVMRILYTKEELGKKTTLVRSDLNDGVLFSPRKREATSVWFLQWLNKAGYTGIAHTKEITKLNTYMNRAAENCRKSLFTTPRRETKKN